MVAVTVEAPALYPTYRQSSIRRCPLLASVCAATKVAAFPPYVTPVTVGSVPLWKDTQIIAMPLVVLTGVCEPPTVVELFEVKVVVAS